MALETTLELSSRLLPLLTLLLRVEEPGTFKSITSGRQDKEGRIAGVGGGEKGGVKGGGMKKKEGGGRRGWGKGETEITQEEDT